MSILNAIPVVGPIIEKLLGIIDKSVTDKDRAQELKSMLEQAMLSADHNEFTSVIEAQKAALVAEIKGESWLQKNWRPSLMLTVVFIIANNYVIYPYLKLFSFNAVILELPDRLYNLMEIGVGGYVIGRSVEKGLSIWKSEGK